MNRSFVQSQQQLLRSTNTQGLTLRQTLGQINNRRFQLIKEQEKIKHFKQLIIGGSSFETLLSRVMEQCQQFQISEKIQKQTLNKKCTKVSQNKQLKIQNTIIRKKLDSLKGWVQREQEEERNLDEQIQSALIWLKKAQDKRAKWKNKIEQTRSILRGEKNQEYLKQCLQIVQEIDLNIEETKLAMLKGGRISQYLSNEGCQITQIQGEISSRQLQIAQLENQLRDMIRTRDLQRKNYAHILQSSEPSSQEELEQRRKILETQTSELEELIKQRQKEQHNLKLNINQLAKCEALKKTKYVIAPKKNEVQRCDSVILQMMPLLFASSEIWQQLEYIKTKLSELQTQKKNLSDFFSQV